MADPSNLGRYQLRRVLGKGAMGVVYEGFDPSLNRLVAVKTILKSVVADEETAASYSARFVREAKAVARLSHPNIVQVYDFGEENDIAYLIMEFIKGRELRSYFEARESFAPAEAVRIMGELLGALEFAHEAGIIHRDIKPANVMLDAQRHVKLADFGVARLQDGTDRSKGGTIVGTPAFMSPEQISGKKVDRRTDLFSAGIILYELLTGEQPFKGEGAWTIAKHIMQDEPPRPSTIAGKVFPAFDQIVNRALAKQPDQRFASAKEFSAALHGALSGGAAPRGSDAEIEFWRSIQASNDPAEFEVYLKEFPTGVYADLARIKIAKLLRLAPGVPSETALPVPPLPARDAEEVSKLADDIARLEAELGRREADAAARLAAEAKARAEADANREAELAKREAEAKARSIAEEKARREAIERAKKETQAELARKEAEYQKREADARANAEAEAKARKETEERSLKEAELAAAKARAETEERVKRQNEELARAKAEAEAWAKKEVEGRTKREAEAAKREAEAAKREAELKKKLAEAPRAKVPMVPITIAMVVILAVAVGIWYWKTSTDEARLAELTAALDAATKASQELDQARQRQEELIKRVETARLAEDEARAKGDAAKLKELQEQTKKAEAEAKKQNELVTQREAESQKAEKAAKDAEAMKRTAAQSAEKAAQERAAQEKAAQIKATEQAASEKAAAEKAAAEKTTADKLAADKTAAEKAAAEKAIAAETAAATFSKPPPRAAEYSDWATHAQYQQLFDKMKEKRQYPRVVEARITRKNHLEIRASFSPYLPSPFSFWSHSRMPLDLFNQRDQLYRLQGYTLVHRQSVILNGTELIQATWIRTTEKAAAEKVAADKAAAEKAATDKIASEKAAAAAGKPVAENAGLSDPESIEHFKARHSGSVVNQTPGPGILKRGQIVYVDDKSCPQGQIKEITGGSNWRGIQRQQRCVILSQ